MEKYYVKAPISGWHEVNKEHFEAFVGNMRKHSTPPTMTIDELIASKTRIVETGGKPVARDWPPAPDDGRPEKGRMCMSAVEKIERQQAKEKGRTAAWMVGEQLKDMARREPESAELLDKDLDIPEMSIQQAEKKIKAYADAHKTGSFACVTPAEAERILREFYGLTGNDNPSVSGGAADSSLYTREPSKGEIIDLGAFL